MEVAAVRVVRWIVLGTVIVSAGATAGFLASLLRPRRYAEFSGARPL
jgi:hypothetical protein